MCTAITYSNGSHYFGRTLDVPFSYHETVIFTPQNFPFHFRCGRMLLHHHAMIGIAYEVQNYPLYYDAMNEKGLCMAGLSFPENAVYCKAADKSTGDYIASFELIPWILGQCCSVDEAVSQLCYSPITDHPFSEEIPASPLHWLLADHQRAITIEMVADGLKIYENPVGVLTNNPPFDYHMLHLVQYMNLTSNIAENRFSHEIELSPFSKGMGGFGLPGDLSSPSRFVRAAFTKWNSKCSKTESDSVCQFFHILASVEQQRGCAQASGSEYEMTHYTSCCNMNEGTYYYRTYENSQICAVYMHHENLQGAELRRYPLIRKQQIAFLN